MTATLAMVESVGNAWHQGNSLPTAVKESLHWRPGGWQILLPTAAWYQKLYVESQPTMDVHCTYLNFSQSNKNVNTHMKYCVSHDSACYVVVLGPTSTPLSTTNTSTCGKSVLTFPLCWHFTCLTSSSCPSWHYSVYSALPTTILSCTLFIVNTLGKY